MNSRVSWNSDTIDPAIHGRADASLGTSLGSQLQNPFGASQPLGARDAQDVADIHQRLDAITRQIERMTPGQSPAANDGVARQLNDAISRLDARLTRTPPQPQTAAVKSPSLAPVSLDAAIAEITARQSQLDGRAALPSRPMMMASPPLAPPSPDFSGLERHLLNITSQIDALRHSNPVEESIAAFRTELTDIRRTILEAMPRHAIESLEGEIRSLARRIEDGRQSGVDGHALAGIERALGEIYEALRSLTPAEQLAGFDEAIRNLGAKIDSIARASGDPQAMHQLEDTIGALRGIVSNVASNEALAGLSNDIRVLSSNVDQLARQDYSAPISALEQRIATLTSALQNRSGASLGDFDGGDLQTAVRALSDRIDHLQVGGNDTGAVMHHVEQRVAHLMERIESSSVQSSSLSRVEDALADIMRHLADQRDRFASPNGSSSNGDLVETLKRELSDIRFSQSETDRRTQSTLETVHSAIGHVADRLTSIESDLRKVPSAPMAQMAMPHAPAPRPELPNPVMAQAPAPQARSPLAQIVFEPAAAPNPVPPQMRPEAVARMPIDASLPPDHPLEPGSRNGKMATPSERVAASEDLLSDIPGSQPEAGNASSFIAAARRAAQAATAAAPAGPKVGRITVLSNAAKPAQAEADNAEPSSRAAKIRSLLVGVSVVVIVLSGFRIAMTMFDGDQASSPPAEKSSELSSPPQSSPSAKLPADPKPRSEAPALPATPSMIAPTQIGKQSLLITAPDFNAQAKAAPQAPVQIAPPQIASVDPVEVTGAVGTANASAPEASKPLKAMAPAISAPVWNPNNSASLTPVSDKLPEAIGGDRLRNAAQKGDPDAAYEVAQRFADGKGVAANLDEAAKWYERAAAGGVTPALFRLGTFYEKGLSVKKNIDTARRYYMQAAERGNAKAMHNLAVLDADGGGQGPNYRSAVQYFRKAADHGIADSQFNLGILYARGIGVEQNLAESYKWFTLAAAQGDADAGRKRDDVAKRLDAQSLAAAKLAIQTFVAEAQPEGAASAAAPAGGWEGAGTPAKLKAPAKGASAKPAAAPAASKSASR